VVADGGKLNIGGWKCEKSGVLVYLPAVVSAVLPYSVPHYNKTWSFGTASTNEVPDIVLT